MSVTTAGTSHGRRAPRNRALAAILAVSVALNLCVVAGAVWSRLNAPPPAQTTSERFHRLGDALDLTPPQRAAFDGYVAAMATRGERLRQEIEPMFDTAWAEIAKPDADEARVMQLLDDAGNRRRAFQHEAVGATLSLLATLTPDQRTKFIAAQRAFHAAQRRRHAAEAR
ncbi:MAG TPA: periplasmic heavy metal sensor [Stellaceae bacterium]|nr:periplasmic heavy metal sensor [Stellaceae bacterium]